MKIALKSQGAGWVLDSIVKDYKKFSRHQIVSLNQDPDVLWSISLFSYPSICSQVPQKCKKVIHVHHIDEDKLPDYNFGSFNTADACLVPNKITEIVAKKYINIPIVRIPYWLLSSSTLPKDEAKIMKTKKQISNGEVLIGSFVKDGNGNNGNTPKLSKGPDILVDVLKKLHSRIKIKVVLAGYSRNYVVKSLDKLGIPYVYLKKHDDINTLYDCLDWYLVTSRSEGGPQSILEASYRGINILSTKVGMSPEVLHTDCLCDGADDFVRKILANTNQTWYNKLSVRDKYMAESMVSVYDDFFQSLR